jgi:cysteine desulfurase
MRDDFGNPSSIHAFGQRAKAAIDQARADVAALIEADPMEVVFTSGGTESDNFAVRGAAEALGASGRRGLVTTGIEHEAILNTMKALAGHGADLTIVPAGRDGIVDPELVAAAVTDRTAVVSVMLANNEIGTVQPVAEVAGRAKPKGALVHTDAVQAAGKIPVSVRALGVDMLSMSAHKFGGPKGIGALWIRRGVRLASQATGGRNATGVRHGERSRHRRHGCGGAARTRVAGVGWDRGRVTRPAGGGHPRGGARTTGTARDRRVPNTTNISFDGIEAESLLIALDLEGVAVSTGSACSSGTLEPSHVLKAMGLPQANARNSLRFSLGAANTAEEIAFVIDVLPRLVSKLRRLGRTAEALR